MTATRPSDEIATTKTKIIHGTTKVVQTEVRFFHKTKNKADTYMNYTRPPLAITFEPIRKAFLDAKNRGVHLSRFQSKGAHDSPLATVASIPFTSISTRQVIAITKRHVYKENTITELLRRLTD